MPRSPVYVQKNSQKTVNTVVAEQTAIEINQHIAMNTAKKQIELNMKCVVLM